MIISGVPMIAWLLLIFGVVIIVGMILLRSFLRGFNKGAGYTDD